LGVTGPGDRGYQYAPSDGIHGHEFFHWRNRVWNGVVVSGLARV
jgi:hypothetical protein